MSITEIARRKIELLQEEIKNLEAVIVIESKRNCKSSENKYYNGWCMKKRCQNCPG